jgi:hypothetical protein
VGPGRLSRRGGACLGLLPWLLGCAGTDLTPRQYEHPGDDWSRTDLRVDRGENGERALASPDLTEGTETWLSPQGIAIPRPPEVYGELTAEGRPLVYWVLGDGPESVLVLGGTHGNERTSSDVAFEFLRWALEHPGSHAGRRLVIAPLVNPDGFARNTRENAAGVDLNRNYPASNWRNEDRALPHHKPGLHPRSEPETRFVMYLLGRFPPIRAISVHGAASCVNWDGPAHEIAEVMSQVCGLPAKASIGYPTPGSLGSLLGLEMRIPTLTLELRDNLRLEQPVSVYLETIQRAVRYPEPEDSYGLP